jgi:hypothetical protein
LHFRKKKHIEESVFVNIQRKWDRLGVEEQMRKNVKIKIRKIKREDYKCLEKGSTAGFSDSVIKSISPYYQVTY